MDNLPDKTQSAISLKLSESRIAEFKSRCKTAIKIDHGINGQSLLKFKKDYGDETAMILLARLIKEQSEFFNLVENISDKQAVEIAQLLFSEYPYTTIEDCIICFRFGKTGKPGYEKPMSRLDGRVIFSWMNTYLEEKLIRIEELNGIESNSYKNIKFTEGGAKVLETISNLIKQKEQREKQAVETKTRMTAEKHEKYLRENISHFSRKDKESLIKQFESRNRFESYNDIINFLKENL